MKKILASLVLLLATQVSAETFNRFGASTGVLKGNATSYQTTPAAASDIVSLWGGTCNSSSFLRGDGSCAAEVGLGNVTSVGLTVPTGLSVTGSPITGAGTLAISTTLNGLLRGTGTGFTTATNSDVINLWTGTCNASSFLRGDGSCAAALTGTVPVSSGGTGATTLTGVLKGNGTAAFTAATSSDVISLWSGTCNSGSVLRGDGSCTSAGSGSVTSVGLSMPSGFSVTGSPVTGSGTLAVSTTLNGVLRGTGSGFATSTSSNIISLWSGTCDSSSFLRGDGSCVIPAAGVSLSGTNTWTGVNTFSPGATAGVAIFNSTATGGPYVTFQRSGTPFGDIGNGSQMGGGFTADSLAISARGSRAIEIAAGGATTPQFRISSSGAVSANGNPVLTGRVAYFTNSTLATTCAVNVAIANSGVSSCSRSALGVYDVTLNASFTSTPTCVVSLYSIQGAIQAIPSSATAVTVRTFNTAGAAADGGFSMYCLGL